MTTKIEGLCSVCCVSYNHAPFIRACVEAINNQTYKQVEIVAFDDGSSDGSVALLRDLQKENPIPLRVIAQPNGGNVGKNFNTALAACKGAYALFMSMDDALYPHAIAEKIALMEADPSIAFVANSKITGIDDRGNVIDTIPPLDLDRIENPTVDDLLYMERNLLGTFYIQGCVFRRDVVEAAGGFDETMTGDDITLRTRIFLYLKKHPELSFRVLKTPACYYRMHDSNIHKNSYRQVKIVAEYLTAYWPRTKNPKVLGQWIKHTIKNNSFKDGFKVFFINERTKRYLWYPSYWRVMLKTYFKRKRAALKAHRASMDVHKS